MDIEIRQIDPKTEPESVLRELADLYLLFEAEQMPNDPPLSLEQQIADWRNVTSQEPVIRWILRDGDGIVASAVASYSAEQNLENGYGRIAVHPEKRRRGYARVLATPLFDHLEAAGRSRFDTSIPKDAPAEAIARRVGLKSVYEDKRSRLLISDVDRDLMRAWIERAEERASDYELVYYQSPIPQEILQKFCDLTYVMNTAPREEFEEEDEVLTPEHWRETESNVIDGKGQLHTLIAVHRHTGDFAGYTQINTLDLQPDLAWQWDTGVDPVHRNKGLGRWLKASMIERIIDSYPALRRVDTYNAGSNEPMLNINIEMGFKPVHIANAWQGDLATVRERFRA